LYGLSPMNDEVRIICPDNIPAESYAEIDSWNVENQCFTVKKPTMDNLPVFRLLVVPEAVTANKPGFAYPGGLRAVTKASGEVVNAGNTIGTGKNSWEAREGDGGSFFAMNSDLAARCVV